MPRTYSTYQAKARFSEVLQQVREGETITVSYRGKPVAEIRPIQRSAEETLEERLERMEREGTLVRQKGPRKPLRPRFHAPGALAQFLAERHREYER